jgi:hypothetical protein
MLLSVADAFVLLSFRYATVPAGDSTVAYRAIRDLRIMLAALKTESSALFEIYARWARQFEVQWCMQGKVDYDAMCRGLSELGIIWLPLILNHGMTEAVHYAKSSQKA